MTMAVQAKIYPACDTQSSPAHSLASGDIAALPNQDRTCDIAGGSCANWRPMLPMNEAQNTFPITIRLDNNPITNKLFVSFKSPTTFTQRCGFIALPSNQGLKIYIGGNDRGQSFLITSFNSNI
eukprot:TRINITY_DN3088_c0_g1_i2.p1 TRINITY_DN3088_c0_g1~~TRINITY_DN3088_c0_g1_i2.p1  ORF type:complete len:124 (-),score=10.38 TRINITY_DN3088_c0_g1_i2:132-503(-)